MPCKMTHRTHRLDGREEVVIVDENLALNQHALRFLKVVAHMQGIQELRDWVLVLIGFLLNQAGDILQRVSPPPVDDHRRNKVAQQVL